MSARSDVVKKTSFDWTRSLGVSDVPCPLTARPSTTIYTHLLLHLRSQAGSMEEDQRRRDRCCGGDSKRNRSVDEEAPR